jgi:hypothetical protein
MSKLIIVFTTQRHEVFYSTVKAHIWDVETQKSLCGALHKGSHFNIWTNVASKITRAPGEDECCKGCVRKANFSDVIPAWEQRMAEEAAAYEAKRQAEWFEADRIGHIAQDAIYELGRLPVSSFIHDWHFVEDDRHGTAIAFTYAGVEITLGVVRTHKIGDDA